MRLFLAPGNIVADAFNLPQEAEHRMVFRTFFNTMFWGLVASITVIIWVT